MFGLIEEEERVIVQISIKKVWTNHPTKHQNIRTKTKLI